MTLSEDEYPVAPPLTVGQLKAIQNQAFRDGMERAAEIAHERGAKYEAEFVRSEGADKGKQLLVRMGDCYLIEKDIRVEAERLKEQA